ncbi:MAG: hypothetical protein J6M06_00335 [Synergistaceae bacterium]|nr:hypothetical protein [Synergistaceae bacterium]
MQKTYQPMRLCLFSKDVPLLVFDLKSDGQVAIQKIFVENSHLLPFVLRAKPTEDGVAHWLSHRFTASGRWLMQFASKNFASMLQISHALSLIDAFWVHDGSRSWDRENLFENDFSDEIANLAITRSCASDILFGRSPEYTSDGMLRKCWKRRNRKLLLLKADGGFPHEQGNQASAEWLAWKVAEAFSLNAVPYSLKFFEHADGRQECVSVCEIFTSPDIGYVPASECLPVMGLQKSQLSEFALETPETQFAIGGLMGRESYEDMMLFDSLVGNIDRHTGNFGMLFDTNTGEILRIAPVFDNGLSFLSYLLKNGETEDRLFSRWTHGCAMSFDAMAECFTRERHRMRLEQLLDFRFPETEFLCEEALRRSERFLRKRVITALENCPQKSCSPGYAHP